MLFRSTVSSWKGVYRLFIWLILYRNGHWLRSSINIRILNCLRILMLTVYAKLGAGYAPAHHTSLAMMWVCVHLWHRNDSFLGCPRDICKPWRSLHWVSAKQQRSWTVEKEVKEAIIKLICSTIVQYTVVSFVGVSSSCLASEIYSLEFLYLFFALLER